VVIDQVHVNYPPINDVGLIPIEVSTFVRNITDEELKRMQLVTNIHRKNLLDSQKANGIAAIFADVRDKEHPKGYNKEDTMKVLGRMETIAYKNSPGIHGWSQVQMQYVRQSLITCLH
jgi:hypothetical protein